MYSPRRTTSFARTKSRRWKQGKVGTLFLMAAALLLATCAWLSLVLVPTHRCLPARPAALVRDLHPTPWAHPWKPSFYLTDPDPDSNSNPNRNPDPGTTALLASPYNSSHGHGDLLLQHLVFGIAGAAQLWPRRREYVKLWWRPDDMRGFVWLEESVPPGVAGEPLPMIRISEDISRFRYTNPNGHPSGIRIARIVKETVQLGLPNVRWIILGDDDTIFSPDNLLTVLKKYDDGEFFYIGNPSESHSANTYFSHGMAFGGGGIAISYPLALELSTMFDECLERYPFLFGSDDRLHACLSELGVPLTKEPGFHQFDLHGDAFGMVAAHPVAPFISVHHLDELEPFFPDMTTLDSLRHFTKAMKTEPSSFLQRCICYDRDKKLSFSVSLGYVVQLYPYISTPRELERPEITFKAWNKKDGGWEFDLDTRRAARSSCNMPIRFYLEDIQVEGGTVTSIFKRFDRKRRLFCYLGFLPSSTVQQIQVVSKPMTDHWFLVPRRQCCKLMGMQGQTLTISMGACQLGKAVDTF